MMHTVAPCVGAWVEMNRLTASTAPHKRRPLCGGVVEIGYV